MEEDWTNVELSDPTSQQRQYRIFVNNCNDYLGSVVVEKLRNDHEIQTNPNIIVGTVNKADQSKPPEDIEIVQAADKPIYNSVLLASDIIIFELNSETAQDFEYVLGVLKYMKTSPKSVVCVSSLLTWDATPKNSISVEDLAIRNSKHDYLKDLENKCLCLHLDNEKVKGYVLSTGILYGQGEKTLLPLFKQAILGNPQELPIRADGKNFIPMIHVEDCCQLIQQIMLNPPANQYFLMADDSKTTQYELVKTIADAVGTGKVKMIPKDEAIWDYDYNLMTMDFQVRDKLELNIWVCREGFAKNMTQVVGQFNLYRGIKSNKIFITGLPLSGKSHIGAILSKLYSLPHLKVKETVDFAKDQPGEFGQEITRTLETIRAKLIEEEQKLFEEAKKKKKAKKGEPVEQFNPNKCVPRLPDNYLLKVYKWRLSQPDCQNKGYVLDGWPKTYEQASQLFKTNGSIDRNLLPNSCFFIESTEEEVKDRLKKLPAQITQGTHWNEQATARRLQTYKKNNETQTLKSFFEQNKVDCLSLTGAWKNSDLKQFIERNGPIGFNPVENEPYVEEPEQQVEAPAEESQRQQPEENNQQGFNLELLKESERKLLDEKSKPIRQYLIDNVIPHLTEGLIQVCKTMPKDPLTHLIRHLEQTKAKKH